LRGCWVLDAQSITPFKNSKKKKKKIKKISG
jgi:hypothetical protein